MIARARSSSTDRTQGRLLNVAALFLLLYAVALTLAPVVRARSFNAGLRWEHWIGLACWWAAFNVAHAYTSRRLPGRDPFLLPIAALLTGWGLLTIWRLLPTFGLRQSIWLLVTVALFTLGLRTPEGLKQLRRYKYVWLTGGLLLTALTLLFGTNPEGSGAERLWLGCCGLYFQPSEPLKLLLIVYLAAYLADRFTFFAPTPVRRDVPLMALLAPTLVMAGIALLLLVTQRDLGTASILLFLYAVTVYIATAQKRILAIGGGVVVLAAVAGYALFDVVRVRVDAWLNPWLDPSGRSYQIVQSLLAVASGGLLGHGPGMGNPSVVPVAHSDFIFAAISEETGLIGALALLLLVALLAARGLRAAFRAPDPYRRFLAAGLTAFLAGQSVLIIGGNLRLLPLTGVTLPFVSYGGSSLLTSYFSLLVLLIISDRADQPAAALPAPQPYLQLGALLLLGLLATGLVAGWWAVVRAPDLLTRTDNPRRAITDLSVRRGSILDRRNQPISVTAGESGSFQRQIQYPPLSNVVGYTHSIYGQSGVEATMDPTLRGVQGNPTLLIWWDNLLYGQPPPGLDIRLTLDLNLQEQADRLLGDQAGAVVLLNAKTGELLAMASHPTFDANQLGQEWPQLIQDPRAPLFNRAAQGAYTAGPALSPLLLAGLENTRPALPAVLAANWQGQTLTCARPPASTPTWEDVTAAGCPGAANALGEAYKLAQLRELYDHLGLLSAPAIRLPVSAAAETITDTAATAAGQNVRLSPLQVALAAAALSNQGVRPAPSLVAAVNSPQSGWVILGAQGKLEKSLSPAAAEQVASSLAVDGQAYWQSQAVALNRLAAGRAEWVSWYLAGTLPDWGGTPVSLVVLLEENNPALAEQIGQAIMQEALHP